jgi:hypothetical protein
MVSSQLPLRDERNGLNELLASDFDPKLEPMSKQQ